MKALFAILAMVTLASSLLLAQSSRTAEVEFKAAEHRQQVEGDLKGAIDIYRKIAKGKDRTLAAKALMHMAECYQKLGDADAQKTYERVVRDFADQRDIASEAKQRLSALASAAPVGVSGLVNRQVWAVPDSGTIGRVSSDGRYVAFTNPTDLMVRDNGTGTQRSIAHFSSGSPGPTLAWSPDGRRLAFEFNDHGVEIRTINVDGSSMRSVLSGIQGWGRVLDFFPDGNHVLCSMMQPTGKPGGDSLVFSLNVADGSVNRLVLRPGPGGSGWPRLSPDGKYVALRNSPGLSLLATDGSGETILSRNGGDLNAVGWSPDSRRVLFIRQQENRVELWAAPIENGKPNAPANLIYRDVGSLNVIASQIANDGSLYYVKSSLGLSFDDGEVYTATADFATGRLLGEPLIEFSGGPGQVLWSPDGKYLAYSASNGNNRILIRTAETAQTRQLSPKLRAPIISDWSPDGRKLAVFGQDPQGQTGIFLADVQTEDVESIVLQPVGTVWDEARYSPDGKSLYYWRGSQGGLALLERNLVTGGERSLLDDPARPPLGKSLSGIRPSPDGRYIAYSSVDQAGTKDIFIHLRPTGEGPAQRIRVSAAEASLCRAMDWIRDGSALIYHCDPPSGIFAGVGGSTWILPMTDLKPRKLDLGFSNIVSLSIHPDGRRIAFSVDRPRRSELHVLQNFLK